MSDRATMPHVAHGAQPARVASGASVSNVTQIAAAETLREYGGEGGANDLPGRPAHPMPRLRAHPSRRTSGRSVAGSSLTAHVEQNFPAAALTDAAAGAFWQDIAVGRVRLTATEDQLVWDFRAAHWRWDFIARHILARRARNVARMSKAQAVQARARYRRERGMA